MEFKGSVACLGRVLALKGIQFVRGLANLGQGELACVGRRRVGSMPGTLTCSSHSATTRNGWRGATLADAGLPPWPPPLNAWRRSATASRPD